MRACGQGYAGLEKFTSLMNMPKPMTHNNFDKIVKIVSHCSKAVARETMNDAAEEIRKADPNIVDTGVSVDGSWQRRGFSSLNGVFFLFCFFLFNMVKQTNTVLLRKELMEKWLTSSSSSPRKRKQIKNNTRDSTHLTVEKPTCKVLYTYKKYKN